MARPTETAALKRIGMNVKLRRIELNLKQEEVVLTTGIARSHLSRIEAGGVNVSVTTLLALADALRCGVTDLVAKVDDERRSS